ncbi:MAG: biotin--[acetyl-CoA-carboxylase] ligase [Flammeovirgaceae bacterium]|nr:MAG: biotin--[acetyl-CoA-carboxylase] ligase [Flammeovirgaceae bacterium]
MYKIPANTLFMGKRLIYMPECHSTNDEASKLIGAGGEVNGTIMITDKQVAGKGQRGNRWEAAPAKNLTFSIVITPTRFSAINQAYLTMVVSLGIHDWLSRTLQQKKVYIKWPNDVLVADRKVCGILIENHITGNFISHAIVGIGLNINQETFQAPLAVSLKMLTGKAFNLQNCFEQVVACIESRYLMLEQNEFVLIKAEYLERLYWIGEPHYFISAGKRFSGIITGTDESGRLVIDVNGTSKTFDVKEVSFVR